MKKTPPLAILAVALLPALAEDWPRFRGPHGSGLSQASGAPAEFGPEKNLSWKIAVGPGHSSPVVCGNQLYLTSFDNEVLRTHAFAAETGKTLWVRDLPRERKAKQHKLNNAASPTPACDSQGVVVYFADFGLSAWTSTGKSAWKVPLPALVNNHGMASSPVLAGDQVIQVHGSDTGSEVFAYSRSEGKLAWRNKLAGVTYSTPAVTADARAIVLSTGELIAFDVRTGKRLWWMAGLPYQPKASPILSADGKFVYVSALSIDEASRNALGSYDKLLQAFDVDGDGQITFAEISERKGPAGGFAQVDLNGDGVFTRQEQEAIMRIAEVRHLAAAVPTGGEGDQTGKQLWSLHKGVPNVASPILVGDILFLFKEGGILTSVRASDGTVLKEGRIGTAVGPVYSSPIAIADRIYIASQQGRIFVVKAAAEWEVLATTDLGEECFSTPAVADGRLFFRTAGALWSFRRPD